MLLDVEAASTSLAADLFLTFVIGGTVFLIVVARLAWVSGDGRDWRQWTARVAVLSWLIGAGLWFDAERPGGLWPNDALLAEAGAVCFGVGVVLAAGLSLGWTLDHDGTDWSVVALGGTGLAGFEVLVVLSGPLPGVTVNLGLALAVAAVASLAGMTRPSALDGARHGTLVAGGATLIHLWRVAYEFGTPLDGTGFVFTVGVLVPAAACSAGAVGGALGGAAGARRRTLPSRA
ncbi:hypothetical protein BRD00_12910 [Halobacteriales archaeon QS_8_69_26]|nr:MAG: hypothetical protein BRD00_12910 [Halobacteriales archaeon QS_8_69_26]